MGPLEIVIDMRPVPLRAGKQRVLLGILLLHANQAVPASELIRYLWGGNSPGDSRAALQIHVTRLRTFLGQGAKDGTAMIQTKPDSYLIKVAPEQLDLSRFNAAATRAGQARARGDTSAELTQLTSALAQWRGRALALVPSDALLLDEAPPLEERRLQLAERRFEIELNIGHHREIAGDLRTFAAEHPMRELLWGQLMLALYRCGRQAEALEAYREISGRLRDELGVDPGDQLSGVYQSILAAAPELAAPRSTGLLSRTGWDTSRPQWKVQCQLPSDTRDFVGRAKIQRQALALLDSDESGTSVPIITLTGSPGVGKTALAIRLAHRVRDRYPDGQWYVNMGGTTGTPRKAGDVLAELLRASGLDHRTLPEDLNACGAIFRAWLADRKILIVFDDVESTEQIRHLLPGTPGCAVIVTRRGDLSDLVAFYGACPFALDVLSADESRALLARMVDERRVNDEPAAVEELTKLCAHLPLALRIAGANLAIRQHYAIAGYVAELRTRNRLTALAVGTEPRAVILMAFELSYRMLPPEARRLFGLLGTIPGADFTVPLAAALAEVDEETAVTQLETLAKAHLIEMISTGRYHFHDLLRLYAVERVRNEHGAAYRDRAARRICEWYLYTADAALKAYHSGLVHMPLPPAPAPELVHRFADSREALDWLDNERANLVAVVQASASGDLADLGMFLADTLAGYFETERRHVDWLVTAQAGVQAALQRSDRYSRSVMRLGLGLAYQGMNRLEKAGTEIEDALEGFRAVNARDFEATALNAAAMLGLQQPKLRISESLPMLERALHIARSLGLRHTEARTLRNLGLVYHARGQLPAAFEHFSESGRIYSALNVLPPAAEILARLGLVAHDLSNDDEAAEQLQRALALSKYLDARYDTAVAYQGMASVHCTAGDHTRSEQYIQQALGVAREHGYLAVEVNSTNILGTLQRLTGRLDLADQTFGRNVEFARRLGHPQGESAALVGLAHTHHDMGRYHASVGYAQHGLKTAAYPGFHMVEGKALTVLAMAWYQLGENERAAEVIGQATTIFATCGYRRGLRESLRVSEMISLRPVG